MPRAVHLSEWHHELVDDYKYRLQQCHHCQKYGHVAKYCRKKEATCSRCGEQGHERKECRNEISCVNCNGAHFANDRACKKYRCEEGILNKQMNERIPRSRAMNGVFNNHPEYEETYNKDHIEATQEQELQKSREESSNSAVEQLEVQKSGVTNGSKLTTAKNTDSYSRR